MEQKTNKVRELVTVLILELLVLVFGMEFFNPFPIKEISNDHGTVFIAVAFYVFSCAMGFLAASIYGLLDRKSEYNTDGVEVLVVLMILGFMSYLWPIILTIVCIFTLVLIILKKRKSSTLWGPFC